MKPQPPISFIVPTYNACATLGQAVESICDGNLAPSDEIIIIDDASTDETQQVIAQLQGKEKRVRAFRHRINKGSAAAGRNTGIEQAHNDLIFCLDADNVLTPNSVPGLCAFMMEHAADAAAFQEQCCFRYADRPEQVTHKWVYRSGPVDLADALAGPIWPGPSGNYLFMRASWIKAGRYDEGVGAGVDSWAFGIRQLAAGARMTVMPASGYYHRYGYDSAFVREQANSNVSLVALRALLPLLPRLEPRDADYVMSRRGREHWLDNLERHPLRLKGCRLGQTGHAEYLTVLPAAQPAITLQQRMRWHWKKLFGE